MSPAADENGFERPKADGFPLAPLIEAVIDVRFETTLNEVEFGCAKDALSKVYPEFIETPHHSVDVDLEAGTSEVTKEVRLRGIGSDPTEIVLLRQEGVATSQLAPYKDWGHLYARFVRDHDLIAGNAGTHRFKRIAVRSLNRIDVPPTGNVVRYEDYVALRPELPEGLDPVDDFRLQVRVSIAELDAIANIAVGRFQPAVEGKASFLVDIDLHRENNIPNDAEELRILFDEFRRVKNELYRKCLTDRALEEFES